MLMPLARVKFQIRDLVNEILDQLPGHVWTDPNTTFLDPAIGGGQFLIEIQRRLHEAGHSDENIADRMYGCEIRNIRLLYAKNWHKVISNHLIKTTFVDYDWGDMKFDVIVGNPPYQKDNNSGRDDDNLWPKFLAESHKLVKPGGYIGFVTPASWGSLGSSVSSPGSTIRKKYFDKCQVLYVDFTCKRHFQVGSSFSSYVLRKLPPDPSVLTKFVFPDSTVNLPFSQQPCFPLNYSNPLFGQIVQDWKKREPYHIVIQDPYPTARASMVKKVETGHYSDQQSNKHPYRAYHTNSQTHKYSAYKNTFHSQWKVVFSYSGSWKAEVTDECSLTDASMCVLTQTKDQAESVCSVLTSAPIRFLIDRVFRWSGYYSGTFIQMIPALPMDHVYTEQQVYDLLFTQDQADLIKGLIGD